MSPATIRPGDRDDPDPNEAIVVNLPPMTASEWEVESRDCTLAEDNPNYPEDAVVAVVCFCDDLIEYGPPFDPTEQSPLSLETLNDSGVHFYTFPAPRLTVIESPATDLPDTETAPEDEERASKTTTPAEPSTATETEPATPQPAADTDSDETDETDDTGSSPALTHLKTTLEADGLDVTVADDETLAVERLGQTYRIHSNGDIDGDGALRAQLATLVDNAT